MYLYPRNKIFWIKWTESGQARASSLHKFLGLPFPIKNKIEAYQLLARWIDARKDAYPRKPVEIPTITVEEFYRQFLAYFSQNRTKNTALTARHRLRPWMDFLKVNRVKYIADVTPDHFDRFMETVSHKANATKNRYASTIRTSFKEGPQKRYVREDPTRNAIHYREARKDRTYIHGKEDLKKLFAIDDKLYATYLQFLYYTGCRRSEILNLRWSDIDLKGRIIHLSQTKSGEAQLVPIPQKLAKIIKAMEKREDPKIFPWSENEASKRMARLRDRLGLKNIRTLHDIRDFTAWVLWGLKEDPKTIQDTLRHKSIMTTVKHYDHTSRERVVKAANRL
jgi:integrase